MKNPAPSRSLAPSSRALTSVDLNIRAEDWQADAAVLGLPPQSGASLSKRTLHGGRQEGVELIALDNGQLRITAIPTRGMGILKVEMGNLRLAWDSPIQEVIHPSFVNLESRGGLGWLQGFNEWLVRCGLEFAGGPGEDRFTTNTGAEAKMNLTLHGKIANIPASEVHFSVDPAPPYRLRLRARVAEIMFYGPKLELWTEISTEPNSNTFRVEDVITNLGGASQEFELIYHINFGPPLLEQGARYVGAVRRVTPMNAHAASSVQEFAVYDQPTDGFIEQVYLLEPLAGEDGRATALLTNAAADRGVSMSYALDELPCFTLWKNTNGLSEGYVTGFEPGTNYPYHRSVERRTGRLGKLAPRQSRTFAIDFALHANSREIADLRTRIAAIQRNQSAEIVTVPPPL